MAFRDKDARDVIKLNNGGSAMAAKITIRQNVLDAIGEKEARVFDGFGGAGEMWKAVWHKAATYVGCDTTFYREDRDRLMFVCDNRRVMRAIDLSAFNVFDLDAHGSPYEQLTILAARRWIEPGERLGLVLTDGSGLKLKNGALPYALADLAGMPRSGGFGAGLIRWQDDVVNRALKGFADRAGGLQRLSMWEAVGKTGAAVRYIGVIFERPALQKAPAKHRRHGSLSSERRVST